MVGDLKSTLDQTIKIFSLLSLRYFFIGRNNKYQSPDIFSFKKVLSSLGYRFTLLLNLGLGRL